MIPFCTARGHVLLTGLELFVIVADVQANPRKKEFWVDKIMTTSGRLQDVPDWRDYIHQVSASDKGNFENEID